MGGLFWWVFPQGGSSAGDPASRELCECSRLVEGCSKKQDLVSSADVS